MPIIDYAAFYGKPNRDEVLISVKPLNGKTATFRLQRDATVGQLLTATRFFVPEFEHVCITRIAILDPLTNLPMESQRKLYDLQREILVAVEKPKSTCRVLCGKLFHPPHLRLKLSYSILVDCFRALRDRLCPFQDECEEDVSLTEDGDLDLEVV